MTSRIEIGKTYSSFESLQDDITLFEQENFVNLCKSDSLFIKRSQFGETCVDYNGKLVYKKINFTCKYSGTYRRNARSAERADYKTYKMNCPFVIKFRATTNGKYLRCIKIVNEHNHELSKEKFTVTVNNCECRSFLTKGLPCRHVLSQLKNKNKYYVGVMNKDEKYRKAMILFKDLASYLAECDTNEFEMKLKLCGDLLETWKLNRPSPANNSCHNPISSSYVPSISYAEQIIVTGNFRDNSNTVDETSSIDSTSMSVSHTTADLQTLTEVI